MQGKNHLQSENLEPSVFKVCEYTFIFTHSEICTRRHVTKGSSILANRTTKRYSCKEKIIFIPWGTVKASAEILPTV